MELLLNFIWILLFLPAWWMWRRNHHNFDSLRCLLSLACVLVILFPVISATDDLHAELQTVEESSATKRTLKHASLEKAYNQFSSPPAHLSVVQVVSPRYEICAQVRAICVALPTRNGFANLAERAPPSPLV